MTSQSERHLVVELQRIAGAHDLVLRKACVPSIIETARWRVTIILVGSTAFMHTQPVVWTGLGEGGGGVLRTK